MNIHSRKVRKKSNSTRTNIIEYINIYRSLRFPISMFELIALGYFDVLLTVHLSIILVTDQLNAQILVL